MIQYYTVVYFLRSELIERVVFLASIKQETERVFK